ncbi:hypothetical protein FPOAC1_007326 [Fusarium poae]|uniref:hypothetical protein n=1 Tax=Fusarium poae TaxID=36050 RepID=UPI001CEAE24F|nr:hypothetical protein FPOAC1_007326 [Fusarium poae]KAG8674007.1 hypothetical protein FPOAC1_007326 [Fusarium poae]
MSFGRPTVNLEPFRVQIEQRKYTDQLTIRQILESLTNQFNIRVGRSTLYRSIQQWALDSSLGSQQVKNTEDSEQLRRRITELFYDQVLNDRYMLLRLQTEGFIITKTGLERIRRDLGLWRRQTPEMSSTIKTKLYNFFENENELHTKLQTFGRTYLYVYVRQHQFILSRKALYECYREFMPTNVSDRWHTMKHRRTGWAPAGPDFIWSLDAYDKLKAWGIEIYAAIDAYSRYITWFYCGISANTSRSVVEQYLYALQQRETMPYLIRSDRGNETLLMAGAHYYLSQAQVRKRNNTTLDQVQFDDVWIYGKSTHNEKIESWWLRLSKGRAKFWREYFSIITAEGQFSHDYLSDRIAILYLYMPIIREELTEFVRIWNVHYIRKQANRPHVNPGQPWNLYFQPEAKDSKSYAEAIPMDRLQTLLNIFESDSIDLDAYLPKDTIAVCNTILEGQDNFPIDSPMQPKYSVYLFLRAQLEIYITLKKEPFIGLLDIPTGGINRVRDHLATYDIDVDILESIPSENVEEFDHRF